MKILVIGATGMLGKAIVNRFKDSYDLILTSSRRLKGYKRLDITKPAQIKFALTFYNPDIVINCSAYTNVNKAEREDKELALDINNIGVFNLATACKNKGICLIHFSTDYVYNGLKPINKRYSEDDDMLLPLNNYGLSKLLGDKVITLQCFKYYIFRTSWLFGDGKNFVRTITNLAKTKKEIQVVNDQYGSPTYTVDLADIVFQALQKQIPFGIYNATNLDFCNWAVFARDIVEKQNLDCKIIPVTTEEYGQTVRRPKNGMLSKDKILQYGIQIPSYEDALNRYLKEENKDE